MRARIEAYKDGYSEIALGATQREIETQNQELVALREKVKILEEKRLEVGALEHMLDVMEGKMEKMAERLIKVEADNKEWYEAAFGNLPDGDDASLMGKVMEPHEKKTGEE